MAARIEPNCKANRFEKILGIKEFIITKMLGSRVPTIDITAKALARPCARANGRISCKHAKVSEIAAIDR
jgi:hypothetical protein